MTLLLPSHTTGRAGPLQSRQFRAVRRDAQRWPPGRGPRRGGDRLVCAHRRAQGGHGWQEFGVIRQLCLYRRRRDPSSYVPEHALAPISESMFLPYIFTHDQVRRLLGMAAAHQGRFIWGTMLHTLILRPPHRAGSRFEARKIFIDADHAEHLTTRRPEV